MNFIKTKIDGVFIIEPDVFGDSRGYFFESYNKEVFHRAGITADFVQDNQSFSKYGVVRGLHFQKPPFTQAKLVRVLSGRVLDVAVDIREGSPTFGQYVSVELSDENKKQFFIPRGFAHGFSVLSETAVFTYKCDNFYHKESEMGIAYNDPSIGVDWQIPSEKVCVSDKDKLWKGIADVAHYRE